MTATEAGKRDFLILADQSADWKIAGLRQLDRLVLALHEYAQSAAAPASGVGIAIFWKPEIPPASRWLPEFAEFPHVRLLESLTTIEPGTRIISTRLFPGRLSRGGIAQSAPAFESTEALVDPARAWQELLHRFEHFVREAGRTSEWKDWDYLAGPGDIGSCERTFLRRAGKSQDGIVSRWINRPLSRTVTRLLLKFPITPAAWTLSILVLPLLAGAFLLRGDYAGIVTGAALFQLYSILDGCDGEIARAKYLESARGARLDDLCDVFGSLIFPVALGVGLSRDHSGQIHSWTFVVEGVVCAALIAANEWFLRRSKVQIEAESVLTQALYPRHRAMVQHSGLSFLGEKSVWWLFQFTKRDVAVLFFLVLALLGLPQWILHFWITVAAGSLILVAIGARRSSPGGSDLAPPSLE